MLDRRTKWWIVAISWGLWVVFVHSALLSGVLDRASASSTEEPVEAPSIVFSEFEYDFGVVDGVGEVSHDFIVKNRGKTNLQIIKVNPG